MQIKQLLSKTKGKKYLKIFMKHKNAQKSYSLKKNNMKEFEYSRQISLQLGIHKKSTV
jgi:hypothetical protein